ncbi:MAG: site-2 protease family protein [Ignavibacteriales bacterium]|nr:site-2 protease family protein [Ignavibacteriales bacterium]
MSYENPTPETSFPQEKTQRGLNLRFLINIVLFILTFFTASVAGVQWIGKNPFELENLHYGFQYASAILFVLGTHEFGHYFAARYHNVQVTLPFFLPFPPLPFFINFGTLGAVIRTRSAVPSRKVMFDIGVAGPLAGFIACLLVLSYGFLTLPGPEFILSIHPNYDFVLNALPDSQGLPLEFGQTILFSSLSTLLTNSSQFVPPMSEIYHYPFLCVGWFGLFVTAMNLIPIGQFDGGHIIYTMFGDKHQRIARIAFYTLLILGVPSVLDSLIRTIGSYFAHHPVGQIIPLTQYSWSGWFLWAMISYYLVKLYHPPVADETPLDPVRMQIGWLSIVIFILCFSFAPFTIPL